MCKKPRSLDELIPYLQANPRVRLKQYCKNELRADEQRTFLRYENKNGHQLLYFDDQCGEVFTPLGCPLQSSMNMHIRFTRTKFSVLVLALDGEELAQFHYYYQD